MTNTKKQTVYMRLGKAPYFLPEAIADSGVELARITGHEVKNIYTVISKNNSEGTAGRFMKVEVEIDEDED